MTFHLSLALAELPHRQPRRLVNAGAIAAAAIIAGMALLSEGGMATGSSRIAQLQPLATPPEPPPFILRDVSPRDAVAINGQIPFSTDENIPAKPFRFAGDEVARSRALECLTLAIYYEAGSEDEGGQEAVAQVVLNRVRHPAFPASICGVVFQGFARKTGCQFTFTCDGSLLRPPDRRIWAQAQQVAKTALDGAVFKPVGLATHYHANYVVPYWATSLEKNAQVGAHIFYRWPDAWGMPVAFARRYAGKELDPGSLRAAAIMDQALWAKGGIAPDDGIHLVADPRIELLAVVQLLANGSSDLAPDDSRYAKDAKNYFFYQADHPAVQLFRKLSKDKADFAPRIAQLLLGYSGPPGLAPKKEAAAQSADSSAGDQDVVQFIDALRDFAQASEFERFFAGHKPFYTSVVRRTQLDAAMARAYWEAYSGMPLPDRKLVLSSLSEGSGPRKCGEARPKFVPAAVLSLGMLTGASEADTFLSTEGPQAALAKAPADHRSNPQRSAPSLKSLTADPRLQEQIIRAVFARVAALSQGEAAGQQAIDREVRDGFDRVPELDAQLRLYEAHRDQFPTLADFIPQLLASPAGKSVAKQVAASADPAAADTRCAVQIAAAAAIVDQPPPAPSAGQ